MKNENSIWPIFRTGTWKLIFRSAVAVRLLFWGNELAKECRKATWTEDKQQKRAHEKFKVRVAQAAISRSEKLKRHFRVLWHSKILKLTRKSCGWQRNRKKLLIDFAPDRSSLACPEQSSEMSVNRTMTSRWFHESDLSSCSIVSACHFLFPALTKDEAINRNSLSLINEDSRPASSLSFGLLFANFDPRICDLIENDDGNPLLASDSARFWFGIS